MVTLAVSVFPTVEFKRNQLLMNALVKEKGIIQEDTAK